MVDLNERIEAADLMFASTEEGIAAIWRTPLFGMSAQRLYAVSVSPGGPASLQNTLECRVLGAYILTAFSDIYADVSFDHYVRPAAQVLVREAAIDASTYLR